MSTTTLVQTESLQHILNLVDPETLSNESTPGSISPRAHFYTLKHASTLERLGYVPTSFDAKSSQAEEKVKAWIEEKTKLGYSVHFQIGHPYGGAGGSERLSVCWVAIEHLKRGGTICQGCIALDGKKFMWG